VVLWLALGSTSRTSESQLPHFHENPFLHSSKNLPSYLEWLQLTMSLDCYVHSFIISKTFHQSSDHSA